MFMIKKTMRISSRFYIASILIGLISGVVCVAFRFLANKVNVLRISTFMDGDITDFQKIIDNGSDAKEVFVIILSYLILFIITIIFLNIVHIIIMKYPTTSGSGLPQTKALLEHKMEYRSPLKSIAAKFLGGVLSISSGLSFGREGTSVQMGSLIGYIFSKSLKVEKENDNYLIAAGAGAGIAAAFTAPLASSILILESLKNDGTSNIKKLTISTLLSGLCAGIVAIYFFPNNIYSSISVVKPELEQTHLLLIFILMALLFSLFGKLFSYSLIFIKIRYDKIILNYRYRYYIIAFITCIITFFYPTIVGGNQFFTIDIIENKDFRIIYNLLIITILSVVTIISNATGFPGGLFIPLLSIGALLGKIFCIILAKLNIVGIDCSGYFILIGMSVLFISVVRTPLTGFVLISEMTGNYDVTFPTLVVGILAYIITEMIKVRPIDDILYDIMMKKINTHSNYS